MIQQQNNNNNTVLKRGRGRPPKVYEIKPTAQEPFLAECLFCYNIYDRNAVNLQQRLINNNNNEEEKFLICDKCFSDEVMQKEYADQNDIVQEFYRSVVGMRRW